jgi:protein SCO1/2
VRPIWIAYLFLLLAGCAAPHQFGGAELSAPHPIPDVELESAAGPVSLHDFNDRFIYVYFGYTFCPDICPATLAELANVREEMGAEADEMQVVMITVDPERDTPERLAEYVGFFDDSFVGLSADTATIDRVAEPFGIFYAKEEGTAATGYLVTHTTRVYLVDRESNAIVAYPHGTTAETYLAELAYLLERS